MFIKRDVVSDNIKHKQGQRSAEEVEASSCTIGKHALQLLSYQKIKTKQIINKDKS